MKVANLATLVKPKAIMQFLNDKGWAKYVCAYMAGDGRVVL
jgi:hypothetical protein